MRFLKSCDIDPHQGSEVWAISTALTVLYCYYYDECASNFARGIDEMGTRFAIERCFVKEAEPSKPVPSRIPIPTMRNVQKVSKTRYPNSNNSRKAKKASLKTK